MGFKILDFKGTDVFVDIASEGSPLPEIVRRLTGAQAFAQDIMYPPGIQGHSIGGDACDLPVPDNFFTKATVTCSLEHFEGNGDTKLFQELARVMKPEGQVCVVPLYLNSYAATLADPRYGYMFKVSYDSDSAIHLVENWGNRHGRFYSVETLWKRIVVPTSASFRFSFYSIGGIILDRNVYARHVLLAVRT